MDHSLLFFVHYMKYIYFIVNTEIIAEKQIS